MRDYFATNRLDVVAAWLFGSVARGSARTRSDVDVALLLERDPPATLEGLHADVAADLERMLKEAVDVVVLNRASCDLVHHVMADGRLLVDRDPPVRVRFEVRKRREFLDLKPYLDRIRKRAPR